MTRVEQQVPSVGRCLLVWLAATTATVAVVGTLLADLSGALEALERGHLAQRSFPELLVWCSEAALVACAAWWWVVATLVVRDAGGGRLGHRAGLPRTVARWLATACGVAALGPVAATAQAPADGLPRAGAAAPASALTGLPLPQRATSATRVSLLLLHHAERQRPASERVHRVEVRPGDTLWDLARRTLPPGAPDAAVARRWPAIHDLNRAVIGPDPDLIQPGQQLRLPRP